MKYKSIKVMPDFESSGIWDNEHFTMINYEELQISTDLRKAFEDWITFYDDKCTSKRTYCVVKDKEDELNDMGRELARRLKTEVPGVEIWYVGEYSKSVGNPELIQD